MRLYTFVQIVELALFGGVLVYSFLATPDRHPSLALVAGGLLIGKALLNILAPEGGTLLRRSLVGYGVGAAVAGIGILLLRNHF